MRSAFNMANAQVQPSGNHWLAGKTGLVKCFHLFH